MGGVKVAVAPAGRPEADIVTTLSKGPPMGGTVMLISTEPPAFTVNDDAGAVTEKVEADVTVTSSPIEVEVAKPALPEYTAVTVSVPEGKLESVKLATPDPLRVAVPSRVLPLKKLTVPAGVPAGAGETVAVRVTAPPAVDGFGAACSTVVVAVCGLMVRF